MSDRLVAWGRWVCSWLPPVWLYEVAAGRNRDDASAGRAAGAQEVRDHEAMVQRIRTTLTDDLDPDLEATDTVVFGLDGTAYEIDLTDQHASQMRDAVQPYVAAARKVGGTRGARPAARRSAGTAGTSRGAEPDPGAVRAWAKEHGIAVSERGRVKGSVVAQFLEATR